MTEVAGVTTAQIDQAGDDYAHLLEQELDVVARYLARRYQQDPTEDSLLAARVLWQGHIDKRLAPTLALLLHTGAAGVRSQLRTALTASATEAFHLPGKHDQHTHGHGFKQANYGYDEMTGKLGDLDARKTDVFGSDPMLREIAREQGFDGPPEVVDDLQPFIDAGEQELFRGVSSPEFVDSYKSGDYWAGQGVLGDGTYTVKAGAEVGHRSLASYDGHLRMTLHKDAKVISMDEAEKELERLEEAAIAEHGSRANIPKPLKRLLIDPGQWAAASGYDAIDVPRRQWMIVLNRTATRVQSGPVTL